MARQRSTIPVENIEPDIVALDDGGFAVAYRDTTAGRLNIAFFTEAGVLRSIRLADFDGFTDTNISISLLPNGYVVMSWTDVGNIVSQIFDPVTMTKIGGDLIYTDNQSGTQDQSSVAGLGNGTHISAWTDNNAAIEDGNTDPDGNHVSMQIDAWVRTSTGDGAAELHCRR